MKQKNKIKRLKDKQAAYEKMIVEEPKLAYSYYRPGSIKKP